MVPAVPGRPTVHLFIGLHKTGSTAIRFMLDVHRGLLAAHGFHVPRATWTSFMHSFWNGGHNNIPWEICGNHPPVAKYGTVADLVREIAGRPADQHILLSEDLDVAQPEHIRRLAESFAGFDVRVIVFVRNQVDWLQAIFAEEQKWFGATDFESWYLRRRGDERLDLDGICRRWAEVFGTVTIRCYEDVKRRVFDAFLECCNAPAALREALAARGLPIINDTPGEFPLALIREAAACAAATGIEPAYFNRSVSGAAMSSARQLGRFSRTRSVVSADVAQDLFPAMQRTNRCLAERFGLALDAPYLNPQLPAQGGVDEFAPSDLDDLAKVVMNIACDVSFKAAVQMRLLVVKHAGAAGTPLHDDLQQLVRECYPWRDLTAGPRHLDDLIEESSCDGDETLYLERQDDRATAFRSNAGGMTPIRNLSGDEWQSLMTELQYRAGYAPVLGYNLRQGYVEFDRAGRPEYLWARHALTANGELAVIERV